VAALAAELGATLHILTLDAKRMTNGSVHELLRDVRGSCSIILVEDVDRALPETLMERADSADSSGMSAGAEESAEESGGGSRGLWSGSKEKSSGGGKRGGRRGDDEDDDEAGEEPLSLAGLLDALAGAGASEGRLLFLTTNHIDKLPRALLRPGIVDRTVEFTLGSVAMVRTLFINFYLLQEEGLAAADPENDVAATGTKDADADADDADDLDQGGECGAGASRLRLAAATPSGVPAATVRSLAAEFAARCGECKYGLADVQGHLLDWRESPQEALDNIWRLFEHERLSLSRTDSRSSASGAAALAPTPSFAPASSFAPATSCGTRRPSGPIRPSAQLDDTSTAEVLRRQRRLPVDAPGALLAGSDADDERGDAAAVGGAGGDEEDVSRLLLLLDGVAAVQRGGAKRSGRSWAVARAALALRHRGVPQQLAPQGSAPQLAPQGGSNPAPAVTRTASARPADAMEMRTAALELAAGGGPLHAAMSSAL
jgi:hypothetical protein